MPRRADSPYTDESRMPVPDGYGDYGETCWFAQNEGQKIRDVGLHLPDRDTDANIDHVED